ncbi:TPA: glycosyltransferase family 2 protein [Vibrio diabolicus]
MSLLTAIIPHYNSFESLDHLLLDLTSVDGISLIVIDDSSNDQSSLKALKLKYSTVNFLSNEGENSAGTCRNIGLKNVKSDWVTFIDADDKVNVIELKEIINQLQQYHIYDILFSCPSSVKIDGNPSNRTIAYSYLYKKAKLGIDDILYWFHVPWSKIYRTSFLRTNNIKFSETLVSNDVIFSLTAGVFCQKYKLLNENFYTVVESSTSLTSVKTRSNDRILTRIGVLEEYNSILDRHKKSAYKIPRFIYIVKLPFVSAMQYIFEKGIFALFSDFSVYYFYDKLKRLVIKAK